MQRHLAQEWEARDAGVPYKTPYEALIMASIVEKETGRAEEREMIAGALVNRLKIGMLLQVDPTVIYGLGEAFDGNLKKIHLHDRRAVQHLHARRPAADADRRARARLAARRAAAGEDRRRSTTSRAATAAASSRARSRSTIAPCENTS